MILPKAINFLKPALTIRIEFLQLYQFYVIIVDNHQSINKESYYRLEQNISRSLSDN